MKIAQLRSEYHRSICERILSLSDAGVPNLADKSSTASKEIVQGIIRHLAYPLAPFPPPVQSAGTLFEQITSSFLQAAFALLHHLRPGDWRFSVNQNISTFEQYEHLADIQRIIQENTELAAALGGDYLVTPDIMIGRYPVSDTEVNRFDEIVRENNPESRLTPLRLTNRSSLRLLLHASISCKWTIRSDRAQNIRTEALNLIRNRKGHIPHVVVVTAEPLPTRLASLALGTGDLDCVYHFALIELMESVQEIGNHEQMDMLSGMVVGRRLRDISDLPFDLAI